MPRIMFFLREDEVQLPKMAAYGEQSSNGLATAAFQQRHYKSRATSFDHNSTRKKARDLRAFQCAASLSH
jgi:hypothetical protein